MIIQTKNIYIELLISFSFDMKIMDQLLCGIFLKVDLIKLFPQLNIKFTTKNLFGKVIC